jgi:cytochrome c oxidase subunit I+III
VTGPSSHGWWAMVILLVVMGMIFAMALFSLAFLWSNQPAFWTAPPGIGDALPALILYVAAFVLALGGRRALGWKPLAAVSLLSFSGASSAGALWLDHMNWAQTGLAPQASGQGATIYALQALEAAAVAIGLLMAGYCAARAIRGLVSQPRNSSIDLTMLFLAYTAVQGLIGAGFGRLIGAS